MVIEEVLAYLAFAGLTWFMVTHENVRNRVLNLKQQVQQKQKEKEKEK